MPATSVLTPEPIRAVRPPQFSCSRRGVEHAICVTVTGELDIATLPPVDRALRDAQGGATLVTIDLRDLEFIDSSGAHLLVAADRRIRGSGGRFVVVVRSGSEVELLLRLTGFDRELQLADQLPAMLAGKPA